jgi:polygalacturonase
MNKKNIIVIISAISLYFVFCCNTKNSESTPLYWQKADSILTLIKEPSFPSAIFNIMDFGAVADGKTLNTIAINNAIANASKSGGGTVLIPEGTFLTGAIHLKSNIRLHLDDKAMVIFSVNPEDFLPLVITRWEGMDCYNYSPLIYGYKLENIAVTGKGRLNGQADNANWWSWKGYRGYGWKSDSPSQLDDKGRPLLMKYNENQVPVEERQMGEGYLRPPFIQLYQCKNILLQDFTIENSPFWVIHPLLSENITVRGIRINSSGPNNDGCDPESCKNMLIEGCHFNTGDDCIALKSGRNADGRKWNIPTENVIVRNCKMQNGHGGIVIGSEISGGCKNIFVENCEMSSPELERAIRIKTNSLRGGVVEKVYIRNVRVGEVKEAVIKINCRYEPQEGQGNYPPLVQNIFISDVTSQKSKYAVYMLGIKNQVCINDIYISGCEFSGVEKESNLQETGRVIFDNTKINGVLIE